MDTTTGLIIIVAIVSVLAAFTLYKNRGGKTKVTTAGLKMEAGPADRQAGAVISGAKSSDGSAIAEDETGAGAEIRDTAVAGDLKAINRNPGKTDPKV